jgi:hypothetical protein
VAYTPPRKTTATAPITGRDHLRLTRQLVAHPHSWAPPSPDIVIPIGLAPCPITSWWRSIIIHGAIVLRHVAWLLSEQAPKNNPPRAPPAIPAATRPSSFARAEVAIAIGAVSALCLGRLLDGGNHGDGLAIIGEQSGLTHCPVDAKSSATAKPYILTRNRRALSRNAASPPSKISQTWRRMSGFSNPPLS